MRLNVANVRAAVDHLWVRRRGDVVRNVLTARGEFRTLVHGNERELLVAREHDVRHGLTWRQRQARDWRSLRTARTAWATASRATTALSATRTSTAGATFRE